VTVGPDGLDDLLANPARLAILAVLAPAVDAEFGFVRDAAGLSDSVLSKQAATLADRGYVEVRKGYVGKRPRTWLAISAAGREALARHVAALQVIARLTSTGNGRTGGRSSARPSPPGGTGP
jgi:DNA-binding MarR family transcriptional regulator